MEVGRVQVEPDPDEDPGAEPRAGRPSPASAIASAAARSASDCCGSISSSSFGGMRNRSSRERERVEVVAREPDRSSPSRRNQADSADAPPVPRAPRARPAIVAAEHPLLERPQAPERAEVRRHADDRDRHGLGLGLGSIAAGDRVGGVPGIHSSIRTWALIPPNPNPLIAARRGRPGAAGPRARASVRTRNGLPS